MPNCTCYLDGTGDMPCPIHRPAVVRLGPYCPTCRGTGLTVEAHEDPNGRSPRYAYPRCPTCSPPGTRKYRWSGPDDLARPELTDDQRADLYFTEIDQTEDDPR